MKPLASLTIGGLLSQTAKQFSDREAVRYYGERLTYRELNEKSDKIAKGLLFEKVKKGDRIAILCEPDPNLLLFFYAAEKVGAVVSMICTSAQMPELESDLRLIDANYLVLGGTYKIDSLSYADQCSTPESLHSVFYMGKAPQNRLKTLEDLIAEGDSVTDAMLQSAEDAVQPSDAATILFTSGSTGHPMPVLGSHYSRVNSGIQQADDMAASCEDRFCVSMPMFHCFCLTVNVMAACASGGCLCIPPSRHTKDVLQTVQEEHCTILHGVPAFFHTLLTRSDIRKYDLSSLRTGIIGGSSYTPELFCEINNELKFDLLSSLGMTEATAGVTIARATEPLSVRSATVGKFMNFLQGKIVDAASGQETKRGEPGEIWVRGYAVMLGYYNLPQETAKMIDPDGWLRTGDMGYLDEDGNLHLTGRIKELIIRGGENISAQEIEIHLKRIPEVRDCKVIGVPDEHYGEEICACISICAGMEISKEEIQENLKRTLAGFKIPKYFLFLEDFPFTATGKTDLCALRKLAASTLRVPKI